MIQQLAAWAGMGAFTIVTLVAVCWLLGAIYVLVMDLVGGSDLGLAKIQVPKRVWYMPIALVAVTTVCIMIGCVGESIIQLSAQ